MKKLLILVCFISFVQPGFSQNQLAESKTFRQVFTPGEIVELQQIFDFFNQQICTHPDTIDLLPCYEKYLRRLEKDTEYPAIPINISLPKQEEMLNQIGKTKQELWADNYALNLRGKYMSFLKTVGKKDTLIKDYYASVEAFGDIPPTLVAGVLYNYKQLNMADIRIKFILAIHYLSLNEMYGTR